MLGCLKLFLHRKSDFTFRHNIPECSAHTLFSINFVHISRMLTYNEYHEINRTSVSYFFEHRRNWANNRIGNIIKGTSKYLLVGHDYLIN